MNTITISKDSTSEYSSIQEAIDSLPSTGGIVKIKKGLYKEKLRITTANITLIGEGSEETILTYDDYAYKEDPNGGSYGTFQSYSVYVGGNDFNAYHISFVNSAGPGSNVGQAIAVYCDADRIAFYDCNFLGHQDTIFLSPLPPAPMIPGSFKGAPKLDPYLSHRSYFHHCYIRGDIDFIFGGGTAYFEQCTIVSNAMEGETYGYVTAASTPKMQKHGFVFHQCKLISAGPDQSVYLGRPWRNDAKTAFISCELGPHIRKEGWHNWDKIDSENTVTYIEYGNVGSGATITTRVSFMKQLTQEDIDEYQKEQVLSYKDGWQPWKRFIYPD